MKLIFANYVKVKKLYFFIFSLFFFSFLTFFLMLFFFSFPSFFSFIFLYVFCYFSVRPMFLIIFHNIHSVTCYIRRIWFCIVSKDNKYCK